MIQVMSEVPAHEAEFRLTYDKPLTSTAARTVATGAQLLYSILWGASEVTVISLVDAENKQWIAAARS